MNPGDNNCDPGTGGEFTLIQDDKNVLSPNVLTLDVDDHGYVAMYRTRPNLLIACSYENDDTETVCVSVDPNTFDYSSGD